MGSSFTRRRWLRAAAALVGGAAAVACAPGRPGDAQTAGKAHAPVTIQIYENPIFPWKDDVGKTIVAPLLAANPWLTVDTSVPAGDVREKFVAATAADAAPDTYSANSSFTQTDFVDGLVVSLESFLKASKTIHKTDVWPSLRLDVEFRDHLTALPYAPDTRIMYTHVENALATGLDPNKPPSTWTEMREGARKAFHGSSGSVERLGWYPFMGSGGNGLWLVPYWQLGGELFNADQTKMTLVNDKAIQALTWLKQVVDDNGGWGAIDAYRKGFPDLNGYTLFMGNGSTYYHATLSERGEQFAIKAPAMKFVLSSYPLPDAGGTVANYGGCHVFPIAKGSKNPDAMWMFLEHITSNESNITFAVRYDRVPIRESSTTSPAYIQGDAGRMLQAQEMKKRRFQFSAPGRPERTSFEDVVTPFMSGKKSLQDSLADSQSQQQQVLDKYLAKAAGMKL
jgi:ABC-type glycerol-3-phosphate transport system substrate-binding protein